MTLLETTPGCELRLQRAILEVIPQPECLKGVQALSMFDQVLSKKIRNLKLLTALDWPQAQGYFL